MSESITIIGAGLSGCEAALTLANKGYKIELFNKLPADNALYESDKMAQLVCCNSLGPKSIHEAKGILIRELESLNSILLSVAQANAFDSELKLFIDKDKFSQTATELVKSHPNIRVINELVTEIPSARPLILATGPLTNRLFGESLKTYFGEHSLAFYDASSVIIDRSTLNISKCWSSDKDQDIVYVPLNRSEYDKLVENLRLGCTKETLKTTEDLGFDACLPVEVIAYRDPDELRNTRFAPKRKDDYATMELLRTDAIRNAYSLNFLTRLPYKKQKEILKQIPVFGNVKVIRYGRMHENSFVNAPELLDRFYALKTDENLYVVGQLSGIDGYLPAVASAIVAAYAIDCKFRGIKPVPIPFETMIGAFTKYTTTPNIDYQPITSSLRLLPRAENGTYFDKSLLKLNKWIEQTNYL